MTENWTDLAACLPHQPLYESLEYSTTDRHRPDDLHRLAQAKMNCLSCPVRQKCLDEAMFEETYLSGPERHGIRGGLTARERTKLAAQNLRCTRCNSQPRQSSNDPTDFSPLCPSCKISLQNDPVARYLPTKPREILHSTT
jgi:hypothetical protein